MKNVFMVVVILMGNIENHNKKNKGKGGKVDLFFSNHSSKHSFFKFPEKLELTK